MLSVADLKVDFQTPAGVVNAVRSISLELAKGEALGIVGESGSGKSVTAYSILGLLERNGRIVDGEIRFGNRDLSALGERRLRDIRGKDISMIFQNPMSALNPIRTVGQQIVDVLRRHLGVDGEQAREAAIELLKTVRIDRAAQRFDAYPFELSGGMCQRVMIALAMACEPDILIADEPTTGLDVTTQKTIMDLCADLCRDRGMAMLLITHDLGLAYHYCDRIVVMRKGEILESGSAKHLFAEAKNDYTKRLIAAGPGSHTRIVDLLPPEDREPFTQKASEQGRKKGQGTVSAPILVQAKDLVVDFGLAQSRWKKNGTGESGVLRAVDQVSFELRKGESLGLVGESGSGKSTVAKILARLTNPTTGELHFDGSDLLSVSEKELHQSGLRRRIQMVFQDPTESLNPHHTIFRSIADPLLRHGVVPSQKGLRRKVEVLAEQSGLPAALIDRYPHQLSGGEKARACIARSIALDPDILILDEPTASLDVSIQALVLNQLDLIRRERNLSFFLISHDLHVVRLMCSRVLVMKQGKIVEEGDAQTIFKQPKSDYTQELINSVPVIPQNAGKVH